MAEKKRVPADGTFEEFLAKAADSKRKLKPANSRLKPRLSLRDATIKSLNLCIWGDRSHATVRFGGESLIIDFGVWAGRLKKMMTNLEEWPGLHILDSVRSKGPGENAARELFRTTAKVSRVEVGRMLERFRKVMGCGDTTDMSSEQAAATDLVMWNFLCKLLVVVESPRLVSMELSEPEQRILSVLLHSDVPMLGKQIEVALGGKPKSHSKPLASLGRLGLSANKGEGYSLTKQGREVAKAQQSSPLSR